MHTVKPHCTNTRLIRTLSNPNPNQPLPPPPPRVRTERKRIKGFPQGQSKLSGIMWCPYKAGFECRGRTQQQISEDSRILRRPGSVKKGGKPSTKTVNWSLQQEHWGKYIYIKKNQIAKFILPITIRFFFKFVLFYLQFVSGKRPCLRVSMGLAVSRQAA